MKRGLNYGSRRYHHERTGKAMPAYVVGDFPLNAFVIEKARRDWDARGYRGSAGNSTAREWWEVRRQGASLRRGVSIGRFPLFEANTLRECLDWVERYFVGEA